MNGEFRTVFEVSCFSNGNLQTAATALCVGILGMALLTWIKWSILKARGQTIPFLIFLFIWTFFWIIGWGSDFCYALRDGRELMTSLKDGQCQVVEGTVKVITAGFKSDKIQIADKDFELDYYVEGMGYQRIIAQGGVLKNGVVARLHYIGNNILEVEIKK